MNTATARASTGAVEHYRDVFDAQFTQTDAMAGLRRAAFEHFAARGFPTQRDEPWKYTNLRRLLSRRFQPAQGAALNTQQPLWLQGGNRIVLANGQYSSALSSPTVQPPGLTMLTLAKWIANDPTDAAAYLATTLTEDTSALEALNLAFCQDGVVIHLADDVVLDEPVYIVHQWSNTQTPAMSHPRVMVRAGRNSRCTIIEQYLGHQDSEYFTNAVTSFDLHAGADVRHLRLQMESTSAFHLGQVQVKLARDARYDGHDIALGASIGRTGLTALLEESGAHIELHGLFLPVGSQHLDAHTRFEHRAAHTTSGQDYRGIAGGKGRGVYNGKVVVHQDAQKIDSRQSSRNLLLSPGAEIDTRPELEIYANDVKCSHGATTGQLDATALFYLRSRGMSEEDARAALVRAFAETIVLSIDHAELRSLLERQIDSRITL